MTVPGPALQQRGDARRTALLTALDELLRRGPLDSINVRDISHKADVTRSAFYFYFANKAAAVGALCDEMYAGAFAATQILAHSETAPAARIDRTLAELFQAWSAHQHVFRAMLDARDTDATVRQLWDRDRASFVPPVAAMIDAERAAGRAPHGPPSPVLATVLLELNDRALERLSRPGPAPIPPEQLRETLVAVWLRTIYGSAA